MGTSERSPRPVAQRHELKTWPAFFEAVINGSKRFTIRKDDRGFREGDELVLREFDPDHGYTGRYARAHVLYLLRGPILGLQAGWVVMSIAAFENGKYPEGGVA